MCLLTSPAQHDPRPEVVLNQHHLLSLDLLPEARLDFEQILRNSCLLLTSCWGLVAPRSSSCSGVCFCQGAGTNTWGIAKARRFQAVKDLAGFISVGFGSRWVQLRMLWNRDQDKSMSVPGR